MNIIFNEAVLITSPSLIRLLTQHHYFIDTRCKFLTHFRGFNYYVYKALLFVTTRYHMSTDLSL